MNNELSKILDKCKKKNIESAKKLGKFIKENRERKGISQRELARRINVDNATISKIEKGLVYKPKIETIIAIVVNLDFKQNEIEHLLSLANYNFEERIEIGIDDNIIKHFGFEGEEKTKEYKTKDEFNKEILDVIKILNGYKENKLNLRECIGMLSIATNTDITYYISRDLVKKYDLENIFKFRKK